MSDDQNGGVQSSSDGGVTGAHPQADTLDLLVAPTTTNELNTIQFRPVPIACWKLEDIRFAFDSSFVTPEAATELQALRDLRNQFSQKGPPSSPQTSTQYPPITIFGHADPVGPAVDPDGYNKSLSGRRATVVYALLIVNSDPSTAVGLWQQVASTENWGSDQQQMMQGNVPDGTGSGDLYETYMKSLCPSDLALTPADFLSTGTDSKGKYQGCSSFNPVLIFSQQEQDQYAADKQNNDQEGIEERNAANAPNRRVMIILFKVGSKVDPAKWPCPRATEGISGCQKRFWGDGSDGETRRSTRLPDQERTFEATEDTFACRFYQRITDDSPCHQFQPVKPCDKKSFPPHKVRFQADQVMSGAQPPNTAWNGTTLLTANYTLVVSRDPCSIRVIVKIKINGAITDAQKDAWQSTIESKWNNRMTLYCNDPGCAKACPDGYPVTCSPEWVTSGQDQTVTAQPGNTIDEGTWGVDDPAGVGHEFGHMLGNFDEYFIVNGKNWIETVKGVVYPWNSPNGSIMNNPDNDPAQRHYELIRKEAGKAMGITCSFDAPPGPGDYPQPPSDNVVV